MQSDFRCSERREGMSWRAELLCVCDNWPSVKEALEADIRDFCNKLWELVICGPGLLRKLLFEYFPPLVTTEDVISYHNQVKPSHRISLIEESMESGLFLWLMSIRTANYDPRLAVRKFLWKREGRHRGIFWHGRVKEMAVCSNTFQRDSYCISFVHSWGVLKLYW